jgi:hypothetical protein
MATAHQQYTPAMRQLENFPKYTAYRAKQKVFPIILFARTVSMIVREWPKAAELGGASSRAAI